MLAAVLAIFASCAICFAQAVNAPADLSDLDSIVQTAVQKHEIPGGVLLVSTPNKALSSPGWVSAKNRHHVREYYLEDFRRLLGTGFAVEVFGQRKGSRLLRRDRASAFVTRVAGGPLRLLKSLIPSKLRRALRLGVIRAAAPGTERHATIADFMIVQSALDQAEVFVAVCRRGS